MVAHCRQYGWKILTGLALAFVLAGCGTWSATMNEGDSWQPDAAPAGLSPAHLPPAAQLAGWPGLPHDSPVSAAAIRAKRLAAIGELGLPGSNAFMLEQSTAHVDVEDLTCTLEPGSGQLSWVMYQFSDILPEDLPLVLSAHFTGELPPGPCFIGMSDYARGAWRWSENLTGQSQFNVSVGTSEQPVSPGGKVYLLVGAWDAVPLVVSEVSLQLDAAAPPPQGFEVTDGDGQNVAVQLAWIDPALSFDPDGPGPGQFSYDGIELQRATSPVGPWDSLGILQPGTTSFEDQSTLGAQPGALGPFFYELRTLKQGELSPWSIIRSGSILLAINDVKAKFTLSPLTSMGGTTVTLNGSSSIHSGPLKWIVWDFDGNGVWDKSTEPSLTTTRAYSVDGRYYPRLKLVMDVGGGSTMTDIATGYFSIGDYRGDWSQYGRNSQHSGGSPIRGPRTSANRRANSKVGVRFNKPSIAADGTVFVPGSDGLMYCFYPSLTLKESFPMPAVGTSTPAIDPDNYIWFAVQDGIFSNSLACMWSDHTVHIYPAGILSGEPILSQNGLHVYAPNSSQLICAQAFPTPGYPSWYIWSYSVAPLDDIGTPAVAPDGSIYFGAGFNLYKLSADGKLVWKYEGLPGAPGTPTIGPDGTIYVPVGNKLFAFSPAKTNLWANYPLDGNIVGAPAIGPDGTIYVATAAGAVYGYAPAGYPVAPAFSAPGEVFVTAPAIEADGRIYLVSQAGNVYCLTKKLFQSWMYPLGETCSVGGLAIGNNGMLYVGGVKKITGFS